MHGRVWSWLCFNSLFDPLGLVVCCCMLNCIYVALVLGLMVSYLINQCICNCIYQVSLYLRISVVLCHNPLINSYNS